MAVNDLKEIMARKVEIRSALQSDEEVDLAALKTELENLNAKEEEIRSREDMAKKINVGDIEAKVIEKPEVRTKMENKEELRSVDDAAYEDAFFKFLQTGNMAEEYRAVATVANNSIVVPTVTLNKILEKKDTQYGKIINMVQTISYPTGIAIPKANLGITASWVAETKTAGVQDAAVSGTLQFGAYKLQVQVGITIEADVRTLSAFKETFYRNASKAIVKELEQCIISGDGNGKMTGILQESVDAERMITVSKFDYSTLCDAEAAIPVDYEAGAVYVMTKKTFMKYVGMVDANKQPIANVSVGINGMPTRTLLGREVVLVPYLPSYDTAKAGECFAFIFNFQDYAINSTMALTAREYMDEATDSKITKLTMLVDGKVVDNNGLVKLLTPETKA